MGLNTSVNIERLTKIELTMTGYEGFGLVRLLTRSIRQLGEDVVHDPIESNYAHGYHSRQKNH